MAVSKKKSHGSGKINRHILRYNPDAIYMLPLRERLEEVLTLQELAELEKQLRKLRDDSYMHATRVTWGIVFRALKDRFGWGHTRMLRLWEAGKSYLIDMAEGRLKAKDIMSSLLHDDGVWLHWSDSAADAMMAEDKEYQKERGAENESSAG